MKEMEPWRGLKRLLLSHPNLRFLPVPRPILEESWDLTSASCNSQEMSG